MPPGYQSNDIPLFPLANEADLESGAASGVLSDSQGQIPSPKTPKSSQAEANYNDGSETIFSLYNKKTLEFDSKHIENWREDANSLIILSGLVSAAVSGFLAQSYIAFQTNSQDVSAFYLFQIYQLQLSLNGSVSSLTPAPPVPASVPSTSHRFWFPSLVMSLGCAVGATMVQEWIRRFQLLTQLWSSPHRRSAHIRASISRDRFLEIVPACLKSLNLLLHLSIYFFLTGLMIMPFYFNDTATFGIVIGCFGLAVVGYVNVGFGVLKWFRPRSLFFPPLLLVYGRDLMFQSLFVPFFRWRTLLWAARQIEKDASARTSTLDADAMSWLLDSLADEEEYERFLAGIPGFYKSTQVEEPAKVLLNANADRLPKAILAFMNCSLTSNLPEEPRQRRIKMSLEAMQSHPYLLQRSFHHALQLCFAESAIFKSVDFVLLADQHADDEDLNTRLLARCIIAIAINHLEDYHTGEGWAGIVQRRLSWPQGIFHREQRDNIKLRNLVQLVRELNTPRPDSDTLSQEVFGNLLSEVCKLNVGNAAPKLQNEFCNLWNHLVNEAQLPLQEPVLRSTMTLTLSFIRTVHISLHRGAESESSASLANTTDLEPVLQNPSPFSPCLVR